MAYETLLTQVNYLIILVFILAVLTFVNTVLLSKQTLELMALRMASTRSGREEK